MFFCFLITQFVWTTTFQLLKGKEILIGFLLKKNADIMILFILFGGKVPSAMLKVVIYIKFTWLGSHLRCQQVKLKKKLGQLRWTCGDMESQPQRMILTFLLRYYLYTKEYAFHLFFNWNLKLHQLYRNDFFNMLYIRLNGRIICADYV